MANPAELLFRQLDAWNTDKTASSARLANGNSQDEKAKLAHELRIATMHLEAIREFLSLYEETGRDATMWRNALDRWTLGLFLYPHGWNSTQASSLESSDLQLLQSLGDLMQMYVPVLEPNSIEKMRNFVLQIREVAANSQLDLNLRRHLLNVLSHIEWCLDNFDLVGEFELEQTWVQLASTVHLLEYSSSDEDKSKWTQFRKNWLNPFTVGSLAGLGGNLLTSGAILMIGR